ncbi:MAG: DNA damage-inducible protein D [Proteobacteria bacterium]|nr:DNA damage-inducible protein D [Pseudomonadota bacterium]
MHHQTFESIRQIGDGGREFWSARQLAVALEYVDFRNFLGVVDKAKVACSQSGSVVADHFVDVNEMVTIGSGGQREVSDIRLSRYACYLIVQNGDPTKPVIANGQTYFAVQTRRQELADEEDFLQTLNEDQLRVVLRHQLKQHNKQLVEAAQQAGVITGAEFAIFQNHGYQGLYGGLDAKGIHEKKGLKANQTILDHMGSTELAANLFRATQAEDKLRREQIKGKHNANQTHYAVGKKVRQTIEEIGGTMPEELPTPATSVKVLEKTVGKKLSDESSK